MKIAHSNHGGYSSPKSRPLGFGGGWSESGGHLHDLCAVPFNRKGVIRGRSFNTITHFHVWW